VDHDDARSDRSGSGAAGSGDAGSGAAGVEIVDRPDRKRYEVIVDGGLAGISTYELADGEITFIHTEVDRSFAGRGLGSRLAAHVLDDARARSLAVRPLCPFIRRYIRSHPAYKDLVR
jgi:predicted GNAT family acetyltransferase